MTDVLLTIGIVWSINTDLPLRGSQSGRKKNMQRIKPTISMEFYALGCEYHNIKLLVVWLAGLFAWRRQIIPANHKVVLKTIHENSCNLLGNSWLGSKNTTIYFSRQSEIIILLMYISVGTRSKRKNRNP